MYKVLVEKF